MDLLNTIETLRDRGFTWLEVSQYWRKRSGEWVNPDAMRKRHKKLKLQVEADHEIADVAALRQIVSSRKAASKARKEAKTWGEFDHSINAILDRMVARIHKWEFITCDPAEVYNKKGKRVTFEALLSDIHYGKLTDTVNAKEIRRRVRQYIAAVLKERQRYLLEGYNVHRIIVALVGDIIESATMHGSESLVGCEFGNAEQVNVAIESLYCDVLLPLLQVFPEVHVPAVTGNHDRVEAFKTFNKPGKEYVTWIIYHMLQRLCRTAGYGEDRITFDIPERSFTTVDIYGSTLLLEHLDAVKAPTLQAMTNHKLKRSEQIGKRIDYLHGGHWHQLTCFGRGEYVINGSVPGQDSYAEERGFNSLAAQILISYCETSKRPTPFFRYLPIYLGEV